MKAKAHLFILLLMTIFVSSCDKENDLVDPQEEDIYEISISVSYSKNNEIKSDSFSRVYIYYEKDKDQFIGYYYEEAGVFSSEDGKTIVPDEHHQTDEFGTLVLKEDVTNKRNFTVAVESYHKGFISGIYYEYQDKSQSMDFIFY